MKRVKLTFSGDIMLKNSMRNDYKKNGQYNFDRIFEKISSFIKKTDFAIGNLETPISKDEKDFKNERYRFTSPIEFAEAVKKCGFDLVSTANNHCLDNGVDGIEKTINCLDEIQLKNTGVYKNKENIFIENINGIKIAFLSYTYGTNAFSNKVYLPRKSNIHVNLFQNQEESNKIKNIIYYNNTIVFKILRKIFRKLKIFEINMQPYERTEKSLKHKLEIKKKVKNLHKNGVDYIVMLMHEGGQYNSEPSKKTREQVKFLKSCGIDLIVGNHEHVIHKVDKKENDVIAYSLGNFDGTAGVYDDPFNHMSEYSILLNIYLEKTVNITKINKATFTILKTVKDLENGNNSLQVRLLKELIEEEEIIQEKEKLLLDNKKIVELVTGRKVIINEIELENEL